MGLDMYLRGDKFFWTNWDDPSKNRKEDGLDIRTLTVQLGYWRKHPNLHGYIVSTFANGVDECQRIDLSVDQLKQIIEDIKNNKLPHTEGSFFGKSHNNDEEKNDAIKQIKKAIEWLSVKEEGVSRDVYYQASW